MERGTDWEYQAVRERWEAMEQRQAFVTRLLGGVTLVITGMILLVLAANSGVCFTTVEGGIIQCTPMTYPIVLILLGVIVFSGGFWVCWTGFND